MDVIVGTAGHIDHGKTALIKALTGIDADRLPEEKRRGITVDLGFAELTIGDVHFGFVDVPGHERFVKNMLAGASGIDLVLLVVAADEGVMPQTREHFDICRLLGIEAGLVAITKTDLVDSETLELATLDAAELVAGSFLEHSPFIGVSSWSGFGIEELSRALTNIASGVRSRDDRIVARLPVDRSFSMKGFGSVVTGTLASGTISEGMELDLLPPEIKVRVRGLQTHGKKVDSVHAGQRVAINLGGIDHSQISRGMTLVEPNTVASTQIIDAEIEVLPDASRPLRSRQRVRVHIGTSETLARIQVLNDSGEIAAGAKDLVQLRFESAVLAVPGERFIIRRYSPQQTIAGGTVIETLAAKHRKKDHPVIRRFLSDLSAAMSDDATRVRLLLKRASEKGLNFSELQARTALKRSTLTTAIDKEIAKRRVVEATGRFVDVGAFFHLTGAIEAEIAAFHKREPLAKGITRTLLRERVAGYLLLEVFQAALALLISRNKIVAEKETVRLVSHTTEFSAAEAELRQRILKRYNDAGLEPSKLEEVLLESASESGFTPAETRKHFQTFLDSGEIVKVTEEFYFSGDVIARLTDRLRKFADASPDRLIDVTTFKELVGVSRKYAIPLMEYFDRERVTSRVGDKRVILK